MAQRMKILIGYDGSKHSDAALSDLTSAGLPVRADVLVMSVGEPPHIPMMASHQLIEKVAVGERVATIVEYANEQAASALALAKSQAVEAARRIRKQLPQWQVRPLAVGGRPASELIRQARDWNADLIVVGAEGHSALGRFFLGSVSFEVVRRSDISVRIGRGDGFGPRPRGTRNLIGLDDTPAAENAVRRVLSRPWQRGTKLRIVTAAHSVQEINARASRAPDLSNEESAAAVKMQDWAKARGIELSARTYTGGLSQALADEAQRWQADCIFTAWTDELASSTGIFSGHLVTDAECSVEVIR